MTSRRLHIVCPVIAWLSLCCVSAAFAAKPQAGQTSDIKHRFLLMDRSRHQLVHVDQRHPPNDWTLVFPAECRDLQLIGGQKILVSTLDGYAEYSLSERKLLSEVKGFPGTMSARRLPSGQTILTGYQKNVWLRRLDVEGKVLHAAEFPGERFTRLVRRTPQGTLLLGFDNRLAETTLDGKIIRTLPLPNCKHLYQALRKPDGHLLVVTGYGLTVAEFDADGKLLRAVGGKQTPEAKELGFYFFAGCQALPSGHIVVSNWTGYGPGDSARGAQLIEFDASGKVVWKWHDAARAGCAHGVIVLDDLDTQLLNDDVSSVLGAVK